MQHVSCISTFSTKSKSFQTSSYPKISSEPYDVLTYNGNLYLAPNEPWEVTLCSDAECFPCKTNDGPSKAGCKVPNHLYFVPFMRVIAIGHSGVW